MRKLLSNIVDFLLKPRFRSGRHFLGKNIRIGSHTSITYSENCNVGDNVFIGQFNSIDGSVRVVLGCGVQLTNFISILNHSSHDSIRTLNSQYTDCSLQGELNYQNEVIIGDYTFIGPYSCIMPGTRIGKGCIVKAYSYVDGEFPNGVVIGGNPAKIIGSVWGRDKQILSNFPQLASNYMEVFGDNINRE